MNGIIPTDPTRIEDALDGHEELHRLLLEQMQDGLYMIEGECFIFVNRALADMLGYRVDFLTGRPYQDIVALNSLALVRDRHERRRNGEDVPSAYESRFLHKDGVTEIPVMLNISRATLADGRVVSIGTVKDITERMRAEEALRDSEQQLFEAQRLGQLGHWRINPYTREIQCSAMFYQILGLSTEQGPPSYAQMLATMHPDDREHVVARRERAVANKEPYDFVYRVVRPNGEMRIIRGEGCPVFDENGGFLHVFGISQDITELRNIEEELLRERHRAEAANRAKSNFLATMSHEIRTPLNAILGFSELMEHELFGPLGNSRYADYIGGIRSSAAHLLEVVGDILDVSTIEAGEYALNCCDLDIAETVDECLQIIRAQAMEAEVTVNASLPGGLPVFFADHRAVKQILINLLSNAVKFTPAGGRVEIGAEVLPDATRFVVTDTGIGIPEDVLPDVTRPFERGQQNPLKAKEGAGLGLAIVDALVTLHGGSLEIDSRVGEGTEVRVAFPRNARGTA